MKDGRQLRRRSTECAAMVANDRTAGTAYGHGGEGPLESWSASNAGKAV